MQLTACAAGGVLPGRPWTLAAAAAAQQLPASSSTPAGAAGSLGGPQGTPLVATTQLQVQQDSTVRVITRYACCRQLLSFTTLTLKSRLYAPELPLTGSCTQQS